MSLSGQWQIQPGGQTWSQGTGPSGGQGGVSDYYVYLETSSWTAGTVAGALMTPATLVMPSGGYVVFWCVLVKAGLCLGAVG